MSNIQANQIIIKDKSFIEIKGVKDILNYDCEEIVLDINGEKLCLKGYDFNIKKIDTESEIAEITGTLISLAFNTESKNKKSRLSALFK